MLSRRTLLLKPMQAAVSGYARLHKENGATLVQLHARGLPAGEVCLFVRTNDQTVRKAVCAQVNPHGEASMETEAPEQLEALLLVGMPPTPLLIGLCQKQDSGTLLDAKNMMLALCERLRAAAKPASPPAPPAPAVRPAACAAKPRTERAQALPREIFLPAIDPAPYMAAGVREPEEPILPPPRPSGPPADRLRPLAWPQGFATLKSHFETRTPIRLFDLPGWRFAEAGQGLFIGIRALDGRVCSVAYACLGKPPKELQSRYQPQKGVDGRIYQVLWMKV